MTLILTHISKHGIIHASDSNLTMASGKKASCEGKKTFKIDYLNAGLTLAGAYSVSGMRMDQWMDKFISEQSSKHITSLSYFVSNLKNEIEQQMTAYEKNLGSMIHIAGYVKERNRSHPEFWFVRNVNGIDSKTGEYSGISSVFSLSEDFWARDCPKSNLIEAFQTGAYMIYINGFSSGRMGFNHLQYVLNQFYQQIWQNPAWKFRPPNSLDESELLVKINMQIVGTLFTMSNYPAPYIGGDIQTFTIPCPANIVTSSH